MKLSFSALLVFEVMTLYRHSCCESAFVLESKVEESCTGESFQPKCSNARDVVLMLAAVYGRMKVGKCITSEEVAGLGHDPKYFECSKDVLHEMHKKCSLKSTCEVKIPDADMDKSKPCFPGLKLYLQSEYTCINVVDQEQNCRIQASSVPKYLTTFGTLNNSKCGLTHNPWIIEVTKGQKIKFTSDTLTTLKSDVSMNVCNEEIGIIMERSYKPSRNITICSNGLMMSSSYNDISENFGRQRNTFTSSSGLVELIFKKIGGNVLKHVKEETMILLKIEADGCTDIIPPEDSWLKRTNDEIVVGCYASKQTWYLRCEDRKWIGVVGNCSHGYIEANVKKLGKGVEDPSKVTKEHQILMFAAICGLGLVICMVIVCVGFICMKKFSTNQKNLSVYNGIYNGHYSMNGQIQQDIQDRKTTFPTILRDAIDESFTAGEKTDENKYFILEDHAK